jgi:hypothetical protein
VTRSLRSGSAQPSPRVGVGWIVCICRATTVVAGAVLCFAIDAAPVAAASRTTAPGVVAHVPVVLTNLSIEIPKDQFVLASAPNVARYPRGALLDFKILNRGKHPAVLKLRLITKLHFIGASRLKKSVSTEAIPAGKSQHLRIGFAFRASFMFELLVGGKVIARHPLVIF